MGVKPVILAFAAFALGSAAVVGTIHHSGPSWVSIGAGVLFGAGGWLVDYFTGFRKLGGQLSTWSLAAGGLVVGLAWRQTYAFDDASTHAIWPSAIQYLGVVLLSWGALMYVARLLPKRSND